MGCVCVFGSVELAPFEVQCSVGLDFGAARWMRKVDACCAYKHLAEQDDDRR